MKEPANIEESKLTSARERMPDLDGLRAIAISLVLTEHFLTLVIPSQLAKNVAQFGWVGVDLFFVISGFLIGGILLEHRAATNYYRVFYVRRFFRIVPLYALLLLPMIVVLALGWQHRFPGHGLEFVSWGTVLLFVFFQQNLGNNLIFTTPGYMAPAWSLAIEEQFYLLLPPLVRHLDRRHLLRIMIALIVAAPLLRSALLLFSPNPATALGAAVVLLPCRWDALMAGFLVAYGINESHFKMWISKRLKLLRTIWLLLGAGMAAMAFSGLRTQTPLVATVGFSWIAGFFACTLLLSRINPQGTLYYWFSLPALKPAATISYGLYLLQGPTTAFRQSILVEKLGWSTTGWGAVGVNLLTLGVTVLAAAASWRFFESRLLRFSHHFKFRERKRAPR